MLSKLKVNIRACSLISQMAIWNVSDISVSYRQHLSSNREKGSLCQIRTAKGLISLRYCAGWSGPTMFAKCIVHDLTRMCMNSIVPYSNLRRSTGPSLFLYSEGPFSHSWKHIFNRGPESTYRYHDQFEWRVCLVYIFNKKKVQLTLTMYYTLSWRCQD